ncbi:MAG TPA: BamA/TamA family outer membrane protein [Vicinamibacterales bacterium]|nr:BamA/TamA family outer membrane protein [Vicinamibacterales bacterium]
MIADARRQARRTLRIGAALILLLGATHAVAQITEILGEVRVHGNHTTPDADILAIAQLEVGAVVSDTSLREATTRLRESGRFDGVEVRKRYRSLDDPSDILVIIVVDEVAGVSEDNLAPGPLRRLRSLGMWLPVIDYADGYGFTYGARITFVDALGRRSRISTPLTWGGERRAAVEVDQAFERGPFSRIEAAVSLTRRINPHFDVADTRTEVRARAERAVTSWLRLGGGVRRASVSFAGDDDTFVAPGADLVIDTRTDPGFPRNAVHVTAGVEQLRFDDGRHAARWTTDARGYVGLFGSTVLALRASTITAGGSLPPYEQALLGGTPTLRGYDFGYRAGDSLAIVSAEVRVPLTSPLVVGKLGIKGFVDAGTVYPHGARLAEQVLDRGAGGGVFMSWAVLRMGLDVAWPIGGAANKPRWHFGMGVTF